MVVPEMERRSSTGTRASSSYPTFSKEHSREAVHSRDSVNATRLSQDGQSSQNTATIATAYKPDDTISTPKPTAPSRTPPSPPLTEEEIEANKASGSSSSRKTTTDRLKAESRHTRKTSSDSLRPDAIYSATQRSSPRRAKSSTEESDASDISEHDRRNKSKNFGSTEYTRTSYRNVREASSGSQGSFKSSVMTQQTQDSQATSVPDKKSDRRPSGLSSPDVYSSPAQPPPHTPTSHEQHSNSNIPQTNGSPAYNVNIGGGYSPRSMQPPLRPGSMMPPPPPPPPIVVPEESPRVDYLLQNGGLPHPIPKTLLPTINAQSVQSYQQYSSPRMNEGRAPNDLVKIFAPVHTRLDDYMRVLSKNGSIAVATGYRSVARRLLDRLETVFARNISSERCCCAMCGSRPLQQTSDEEETGISWGEILEFVAGRRELPQWPPFSITAEAGGLGIVSAEPMQNLDPDVPPEWRDHYKKQNAKIKRAVEGWLSKSEDTPTNAPTEVDDETLTFAILTHIETERRPTFIALKKGMSEVPPPGAPEPAQVNKNDALQKVSLALIRLYRLPTSPREAECCIYLLNNPHLHNTLSTLAAVTAGEWDILVSGRFDGFLWSGAETQMPSSQYGSSVNMARGGPISRNTTPFSAAGGSVPLSRGNTPFSPLRNVISPDNNNTNNNSGYSTMFPSRNTTPAPGSSGNSVPLSPAPVQMDEETEIMMLAEIEREIFRGMEELEGQFEKLHYQAEAVRQRLRERGAGLSMAAQARRGSLASEFGVRSGTPGSGMGGLGGLGPNGGPGGPWIPDVLEGSCFDDGRSELAPDDSASNVGARRHRREGRHSRRTPASVAEEEEGAPAAVVPEGEREKKGGLFRRRW